jgi:hypothetical protein
MAARAIASESDRGVGAAVDRGRDSRVGELSVAMKGRGVGVAVEADRENRAGELFVAMRKRGVVAAVEADRERQANSRARELSVAMKDRV